MIGQPSFIESYERTSIYPKLDAYIEKWKVDIGDKVKKGDVLATLFVPEMVEDFGTKNATVELDRERIELAKKLVNGGRGRRQGGQSETRGSQGDPGQVPGRGRPLGLGGQATQARDREGRRRPADPPGVDQSVEVEHRRRGTRRRRRIMKAEAELLSREATLAKAKVDVTVARADLAVAQSEARRLKAWVGYLTLTAPYDGVIVTRNANTGDFVLPATGDPSAMERSPNLSHSGAAAPIYVVDRTDVVRIFVDVPEQDANYVRIGTKASVLVEAYRDEPIPGTVTRTSWALNVKSRTLRAEIDLLNPGSQLLPGMYAYAEMTIERPGVRALPLAALTYQRRPDILLEIRERPCRAHRDPRGVSDDEWIEVTKRRAPGASPRLASKSPWTPIDGSEQVILGDLSILTEGRRCGSSRRPGATKIANVIE